MIAAVSKSIMKKYKAEDSFKSSLGGLYFQQAPPNATSPYAVFYIMGITHDEIMGGADDNISEVEIQFNIFSEEDDGGENIAELSDQLMDVFDWKELTIKGYDYIKMQRQSVLNLGYADGYWQTTIIYNLWIKKE